MKVGFEPKLCSPPPRSPPWAQPSAQKAALEYTCSTTHPMLPLHPCMSRALLLGWKLGDWPSCLSWVPPSERSIFTGCNPWGGAGLQAWKGPLHLGLMLCGCLLPFLRTLSLDRCFISEVQVRWDSGACAGPWSLGSVLLHHGEWALGMSGEDRCT